MVKKRAIIFDWWNTLWHPEQRMDFEVQQFLQFLHDHQKVFLGIISNTPEDDGEGGRYVRRKLKELQLLHIFEFVIVSGTIKIHKPNSEIFYMAMRFLPCEPEEILMVGDSETCDGGCRAVGIDYFKVDMKKEKWVGRLKMELYPFFF